MVGNDDSCGSLFQLVAESRFGDRCGTKGSKYGAIEVLSARSAQDSNADAELRSHPAISYSKKNEAAHA
jgi:hypothetical protein